MAIEVSRRFLVPTILSHTRKRERLAVLDGFAKGRFEVLVANRVLDEGVDVPEAKVAVVIGGQGSTRQKTFVADFTFRHQDGTEVLLEIVGFWTPEYLAHRRETLQQFRLHRILIAVPEKSLREGASISKNVLVYKTALKLAPLMEALEKIRTEKFISD